MANRILRDDPSKGDMHNRQGLSLEAFRMGLSDYHMWPIYLIGLSWLIPSVPMQGYITLNMTAVGFGTVSNLIGKRVARPRGCRVMFHPTRDNLLSETC